MDGKSSRPKTKSATFPRDKQRLIARYLPLVIAILVLASLVSAPAGAMYTKVGQAIPSPQTSSDPEGLSPAGMDSDWNVLYHAGTGQARFLSTFSGRSIPQPRQLSATATPEQAARSFLGGVGALFGLQDQAAELTLMGVSSDQARHSFVRFQQNYQGLPVMGGELIVQLDQAQNVRSVSGEVMPALQVETVPVVSAEAAEETAVDAIAKEYRLSHNEELAGKWLASPPELWVYQPDLLGAPGLREARLVWRTTVSAQTAGGAALPVRELVLVDAKWNSVALHFSQLDTALYREIYDNTGVSGVLPGAGLPVRVEGGAATGILDVDNAYDYTGFTYDFYHTQHARDSIDNRGMKLISTVHYCPSGGVCPYENAFWNGSQMVFGDGYASADDVVGHELTHGVTENESGLYYYMQSGAINEAFSDIWGEFIDQSYTNGLDTDAPAMRWLIGEDLPGGAIRDMKNPPAFNQPDRGLSSLYHCDTSDDGGVHINSGVIDKAAYLLTDGDTFNGITVNSIGMAKVAQIFYGVQAHMLTSAADFPDLATALVTTCDGLWGVNGITSADCQEVRNALAAVELDRLPACAYSEAPSCEAGSFSADFNGSAPGWSNVVGQWQVDANYLYTQGSDDLPVSIAYAANFTSFDLQATMRRTGNDDSGNGVLVRGMTNPLTDNNWYQGYLFEYARNGQFSVWRLDHGVRVSLLPWTYSAAINTGTSWNTLRVVAGGNTFKFYINNYLVWTGVDNTYSMGQIGFRMYKPSGSLGDLLEVDALDLDTGGVGTIPVDLFNDSLEDPTTGNWTWAGAWHYPQSNNAYSEDPHYATSGAYNFWGEDLSSASDHTIHMTRTVTLPAGKPIYMSFQHAYQFEGQTTHIDGGVVEYSRNEGPWTDAGPLFIANGYNGILSSSPGSPLIGRSAFTGLSYGMYSSRLNLTSLGGGAVRFRFRIGTDNTNGDRGWFIDDVSIYTCEAPVSQMFFPMISHGTSTATAFHSAFNGYDTSGWQVHSGAWTPTPITYAITGLTSGSATTSYTQDFKNFIFEARMKRFAKCTSCANRLLFRGVPLPLDAANDWYNTYAFQYTTDGLFSFYKRLVGGAWTPVVPWTSSTAILQGNSWNILKVKANGSRLDFYINGTWIWTGSDASLSSGRVGLGMFSSDGWDRLDVDWAQLYPIGLLPSFDPPGFAPQIAPLIGGSVNQAP
jgi:Zn-dependent metalloprotease